MSKRQKKSNGWTTIENVYPRSITSKELSKGVFEGVIVRVQDWTWKQKKGTQMILKMADETVKLPFNAIMRSRFTTFLGGKMNYDKLEGLTIRIYGKGMQKNKSYGTLSANVEIAVKN